MNSQPDTPELEAPDNSIEAAAERLLAMESEQDDPEQEEAREGEGEAQSGESAEDASEGEQQPPPKRKLKVGEDELDEDEVIAGYMKDADYRRKTAEAAELRRKAEAEIARYQQELAPRVAQLDASLSLLHKELIGGQQELEQLIRTNPAEYLARKHQLDQKAALFQQALQQRQALDYQQQAEAEKARQARVAEEGKRLQEKLPTWRDASKAQAEQREIAEVLVRDYGYDPSEVAEVLDHRAVLLARDAMLYRKQIQTKAQQKATPPPAVKPGTPNPGPSVSDREKALQRELKRTGNPEIAAELMLLRSKKK